MGMIDSRLANRGAQVGRDEDAKHRNVDGRDHDYSPPSQILDVSLAFSYDGDSIYDYL